MALLLPLVEFSSKTRAARLSLIQVKLGSNLSSQAFRDRCGGIRAAAPDVGAGSPLVIGTSGQI
jgi:hypothetical protein